MRTPVEMPAQNKAASAGRFSKCRNVAEMDRAAYLYWSFGKMYILTSSR